MQLQFKRNNIAERGMRFAIGGFVMNYNRVNTLFDYQYENAKIQFTDDLSLSELRLQSTGLEQDFFMRSLNGIGVLGAVNKDWLPNRKENGINKQNVALVDMGGEHIYVDYVSKKGQGLFGRYAYWSVVYQEHTYDLYEVGLGRDGSYLCIYQDDVTVAQCQLHTKVVNYENEYTMYAVDDLSKSLLVMIMTLWDVQGWFLDKLPEIDGAQDLSKKAHHNTNQYSVSTLQKDLKAKYDPNFIKTYVQ